MTQPSTRSRDFRVPGAARIRTRDLPFFCRSLSAMLDTGMVLGDCLRALEEQQANPHMRAAISWMRMDIEAGKPLSDSIRQFPSLFDTVLASMIAMAEQTGRLPEILAQIAGLLETRNEIRHKINTALIYPAIVIGLAIVLSWFLVAFVVPALETFYDSMDSALPAPTRALLAAAGFFRQDGIPVLVSLFAIAAIVTMVQRTAWGASRSTGSSWQSPWPGRSCNGRPWPASREPAAPFCAAPSPRRRPST
jgi:type II secretory pathway component PulF